MTKQQISAAILETEKTLANLRKKLEEPEKLESFKTGDVFSAWGNVLIIVVEIFDSNGPKYHIIGYDDGRGGYLRPYSDFDVRGGADKKKMLDYLNRKITSGWKYVGNISEKFDEAVREMIGKE